MARNNNKGGNDITQGVIWKQLLVFFIPVLIGAFFQQLYNTVDTIIVGQFAGTEALSSVGGSSSMLINMIIGFFMGLSSGCTVLISQFFGAHDDRGLEKALHTAYAFSIFGGIFFGILGMIIARPVLKLLNTPYEIMGSSLLYMRIYFSGLVFVFVYNMGSAVFRAAGDSKRPLYYLIFSSVVNIVGDLVLVCIFRLGVAGVAIATMISQGLSAILIVKGQMQMEGSMRLDLKKLRIDTGMLGHMLRIGLPSGLQSSMYSISNATVQAHLNTFGVVTMAAWSAYGKIDGVFWMINNAFGITVATFAGQNYGAKKPERIKAGLRIAFVTEIIVAFLLSFLAKIFGPQLLGIFSTDPEVIADGMIMLGILAPYYFTFVFVEQFADTLRAEGCVAIPTIVTLCGVCLFRIVWLTWIIPDGNLQWILYCYPIAWVFAGTLMTAFFLVKQPKIIKALQTEKM